MKITLMLFILLLVSSCLKESKTPKKKPLNRNPPSINTSPESTIEEETDSSEEGEDAEERPVEIDELTYYQDSTYLAKFETLNPLINGKIPGSATIHFKNESIYTYVRLFGGQPKAWHQQKIYEGTRCPTLEDDLNQDGHLDIIEAEKVTGKILIPLDANISSQKAGKNFYPIGDESGNYFYERITQFDYLLRDLKSDDTDLEDNIKKLNPNESLLLEGKPVMILGISQERDLPESVASFGKHKAYQTYPIVCAIFKKVTDFPTYPETEEIPGPIEEIDLEEEIEGDDEEDDEF